MDFTKIINVIILVITVTIIIVQNSNANDCLNQITNIGRMDINSDGTEAFSFAYLHLSYRHTKGYEKDILRRYLLDLYNAVVFVLNVNVYLNPMQWCLFHMSNFSEIEHDEKISISICDDKLTSAGFDNNGDARKAFFYAYFETTFSSTKNNDIAREYMKYMLKLISPHIIHTNALRPQLFCLFIEHYPAQYFIDHFETNPLKVSRESYHYEDCINLMASYEIDININGAEVFEYTYLKLNKQSTSGSRNVFLRQYLNDLFPTATLNYLEGKLENPKKFCLENIKDNNAKQKHVLKNFKCDGYMNRAGFDKDAKEALKYAYFHLVDTKSNIHQIAKTYYNYLIQTFKPLIDLNEVLGPHQYCLNNQFVNTSDNYQNNTLVANQFSIDQDQTDPNLYSNLNPLLESTAAGSNINQPDTGNQFEIAQYPPDSSEIQDPYLFFHLSPTSGFTFEENNPTSTVQFNMSGRNPFADQNMLQFSNTPNIQPSSSFNPTS